EVAISVRDNGDGIPAELMPRIFDIFAQGDQSLERTRGGLRLGLALVRSLTEMQGGTVEAQSPGPGKGSTFTIHMPLAAPGAGRDDPPAPADQQRPMAGKRRRILVVDDNQDQAQSLGILLELLGHDVKTAYDGHSAVAIAKEFVPDVALVDIGLPGLNGFDVARRIREQPGLEKIVLIAQTGWGQEEDRRRTHEAGFDRHLVKPVEISAVQEILASIK